MCQICQYVVYDHPSDFPNSVVVRRWHIANGQPHAEPVPLIVGPSLEAVRERLRERGLMAIPRMAGDDPVIVEVWL